MLLLDYCSVKPKNYIRDTVLAEYLLVLIDSIDPTMCNLFI